MSRINKLKFSELEKLKLRAKVNKVTNSSLIEQYSLENDLINTLVLSTLKTDYAWVRKTLLDLLSKISKGPRT